MYIYNIYNINREEEKCKEHKMELGEKHYENGFICDQCRFNLPSTVNWYHCKSCQYDLCLNCCPLPQFSIKPSLKQPRNLYHHLKYIHIIFIIHRNGKLEDAGPHCKNGHELKFGKFSESGYKCDGCRRKLIYYKYPWYHCGICNYDLCTNCCQLKPKLLTPPKRKGELKGFM